MKQLLQWLIPVCLLFEKAINGIDMGPDLYWGISKDNTPAQQAEAIRNTWKAYIDTANGL